MGSANDREAWWLNFRSPMLAMPPGKFFDDTTPTEVIHQLEAQGYYFDMKWDGVRAVAYCEGGSVDLRNRNGVDIAYRYPDVIATLGEVTKSYGRIVLDGEVVVFAEDGKPDFGLVSRRDRVGDQAKALRAMEKLPATFVAFDMLDLNGDSLTSASFAARRAMLEAHLGDDGAAGPDLFVVSPISTKGAAMWSLVQQMGLEGLIAKDPTAVYATGYRADGWIKVKDLKRVSCFVIGMQEGSGKHLGKMGALLLGVLDDSGDVIEVGKVGTGFSDHDREQWWTAWGTAADPLHDLAIIEVEYLDYTDAGVLRFPSYKGVRNDLERADCTIDQLT